MEIIRTEFQRRTDILNFFRKNNIAPTSPRIELAYSLMRKANHFTAEEAFIRLNKKEEMVSKATVYNNLSLFVEMGLLKVITVSTGLTFYDSNSEDHFHFFDERNNRLYDIPVPPSLAGNIKNHIYENISKSHRKALGRKNENLNVVLYG